MIPIGEKPKYLDRKLSQCRTVHQRSYVVTWDQTRVSAERLAINSRSHGTRSFLDNRVPSCWQPRAILLTATCHLVDSRVPSCWQPRAISLIATCHLVDSRVPFRWQPRVILLTAMCHLVHSRVPSCWQPRVILLTAMCHLVNSRVPSCWQPCAILLTAMCHGAGFSSSEFTKWHAITVGE